jgi:hypothetical protein
MPTGGNLNEAGHWWRVDETYGALR